VSLGHVPWEPEGGRAETSEQNSVHCNIMHISFSGAKFSFTMFLYMFINIQPVFSMIVSILRHRPFSMFWTLLLALAMFISTCLQEMITYQLVNDAGSQRVGGLEVRIRDPGKFPSGLCFVGRVSVSLVEDSTTPRELTELGGDETMVRDLRSGLPT